MPLNISQKNEQDAPNMAPVKARKLKKNKKNNNNVVENFMGNETFLFVSLCSACSMLHTDLMFLSAASFSSLVEQTLVI